MPILRTFATADIGGTVYKVRIEKFKRSGYVTVWDGGSEHEVRERQPTSWPRSTRQTMVDPI